MKLETSDLVGFIKQRHFQQVRSLKLKPVLAIAAVGEVAASASFIRAKQSYGSNIGASVVASAISTESALIQQIKSWNQDNTVTGIVVQLPLPANYNTDRIIQLINSTKDVDGLRGGEQFESATAKAVMWILAAQGLKLADQQICVVGQGRLVGAPVTKLLKQAGAQVDVCDIETSDLASHTRVCDIVISGVGKPGLITRPMLKADAIVIDAGTAEAAGQLAGDADPELDDDPSVRVTPVPGGVGPMTVAALFDNLLIAGVLR